MSFVVFCLIMLPILSYMGDHWVFPFLGRNASIAAFQHRHTLLIKYNEPVKAACMTCTNSVLGTFSRLSHMKGEVGGSPGLLPRITILQKVRLLCDPLK